MESIAYSTFGLETPCPSSLSEGLEHSVPSALPSSVWFKTSWAVMGSAATLASLSIAPMADAIVGQGDTCPEVNDIQNSLTTANYPVGTIDGIFGAQTYAAVVQFQVAQGLEGDGIVGPMTAQALELEAKEVYALNTLCSTPIAAAEASEPLQTSETVSSQYIVIPDALNVRSGSSKEYPVVAVLTKGASVTAIAEESGWIQIGENQWIAGEFVTLADSPVLAESAETTEPATALSATAIDSDFIRVAVPLLNVRSGPSTDYPVVGSLVQDEIHPVSRLSTPDGWVQLAWGDWISSAFVVPLEQATEIATTAQ